MNGHFFLSTIVFALDPYRLTHNNSVCMWKDDGCNRPLIPKGGPPAFQSRPLGGHGLVGCYGDKEMIIADAHDAKKKKEKNDL